MPLYICSSYPESFALDDIANVSFTERPSSVVRTGGKLSATVTGLITAEDIGSVNHNIQQKIDALPEATGVEVTMGGMAEMMTENMWAVACTTACC